MAKRKAKEISTLTERLGSWQDVIKMTESAQNAEFDMRSLARQCVLFCIDQTGQWEPYWWAANNNKPRYTLDLTTPIIDQIMGEIYQTSFDCRVSPAGGDSTKETAMIYEGLIRAIENWSGATDIYRDACRASLMGGFAAWRIVNKYVSPDSFDQDLVIEPIGNPLDRVWFDPAAERQDKSDARWCVILHAVAKDEYKERWPDGSCTSVGESRNSNAYYFKADTVVIGELLWLKEFPEELVLMNNGSTYAASELEPKRAELEALGVVEIKRRKTMRTRCYSHMFDGTDWLQDEEETVFDTIPVVPIFQNYYVFEDKNIYFGHVMRIMDPQRILNYSISREIEEGALAPRSKYWMTMKQAEGHQPKLSTLNTNSDPVQFYNNDPEVPGPPQQIGGARINEGLRVITESMRQMIGQVGGMFAANMGDNPGLQSGVAIDALQNKGDNGTLKFTKSLETAIAYGCKLLVSAIPRVYDTRRQKRLIYDDGTMEVQTLNDEYINPMTMQVVSMNDLSKGQYDVVCKAGPSFRNKQEETTQVMLELAKVDPSLFQIGGDLFLKNLSTPVSEQLAERKRAQMITQGLIPESQMTDEEKQAMQAKQGQQQQPDPAMVLAQAEMAKAQAEMMRVENDKMKLQIEMMKLQQTAESDQSKTVVAGYNAETNRMKAEAEIQKAGVEVEMKGLDATGKVLDNMRKRQELMTPPMMR